MPLRTQFRRLSLLHGLPSTRRTFLTAILLLLLTLTAGCRLPDLPAADEENSLAVEAESATGSEVNVAAAVDTEAVEENVDKQAGVAAAAAASVDDTGAESNEAVTEAPAEEVAVEAPVAEAPANVDWLTVTDRADYELPALGNPDAALTITEFSDFM